MMGNEVPKDHMKKRLITSITVYTLTVGTTQLHQGYESQTQNDKQRLCREVKNAERRKEGMNGGDVL